MIKWIAALLFLLSASRVFSGDLVPQHVALGADKKAPFYNFDILFQKAALSSRSNGQNVIVLEYDPSLPEGTNQAPVSGIIIVKTITNSDGYFVLLFDNTGSRIPSAAEIPFDLNNIVDSLPDMGDKIVKALEGAYKPVPKEDIVKIENVVITYSQFEPLKPVWTLTVGPGNRLQRFGCFGNHQFRERKRRRRNRSGLPGGLSYMLAADILYQYHEWSLFAAGAAGFPFGNDNARIGFGYGLFGSIFVIGIEGMYYGQSFQPGGNFNFYSGGGMNQNIYQIPFPDLFIQGAGAGIVMKLNIETNFSIEFRAGGLFWNEAALNFNNSAFSNVMLNGNTPNPVISVRLNVGLIPGSRFILDYSYIASQFSYQNYNGNNTSPVPVGGSPAFYLSSFSGYQSLLELGISYEL